MRKTHCKRGHLWSEFGFINSQGCRVCRECGRMSRRENYARNPDKIRAASRKWAAENPEKKRAAYRNWRAENLEKERAAKRKWRAENPEKNRAQNRKWKAENPEKVRASHRKRAAKNAESMRAAERKWRTENPEKVRASYRRRRSRKLDQLGFWPLSESQFVTLLFETDPNCYYCRTPLKGVYHLDHKIPLSRPELCPPGKKLHEPWNCRLSCVSCNLKKSNKTAEEFRKEK